MGSGGKASGNGGATSAGGTSASSGGSTGKPGSGGAGSGGKQGTGGSSASTSDAGTGGSVGAGGNGGAGGSGGAGGNGGTAGAGGIEGGVPDASTDGGDAGPAPPPPMISSLHEECDGGDHGCPEPSVLATVSSPWAVAIDADHVYWTESVGSGAVKRIPIGGGAQEPLATGLSSPTYITVAGGNVFWVDHATVQGQMYPGRLMQATVTGANAQQIAPANYTGVASINSDGQNVYYWDNFNIVFSVPVGGGAGKTVYGGIYNTNIVDLVLFNGNLYWSNSGVWNNTYTAKYPGTADIDRLAVSGQAEPELIVPSLNYPLYQVAADAAHTFYNDAEFIYRTGAYGGRVIKLVQFPKTVTTTGPVTDMASDGTDLYFSDGKVLYSIPTAGGTPTVRSWGWKNIESLAVDANNVYFVDTDGGSVVQISK